MWLTKGPTYSFKDYAARFFGRMLNYFLGAMGIICLDVESAPQVAPTVEAALRMTFQSGNAVAVLLTQKLIGAKAF